VSRSAGILGHGIDLASIARVAEVLERHGSHFIERCFTAAERDWAEAGGRQRTQRYAGRFAAKEAAAKALGTGVAEGIRWTDLEILADERGAPRLSLHGVAAERAAGMGVGATHCSITHAGDHAMASVILTSG
jgi:holo-[acyl-carrier protein] synthase